MLRYLCAAAQVSLRRFWRSTSVMELWSTSVMAFCSSDQPAEGLAHQVEVASANTHDKDINLECDLSDLAADMWSRMPEELLEKVIARLPFRSLFQARSLSKSWASNIFSASFQNEVSLSSRSNWSLYCPLYVGNDGLIGYDTISKRCETILSLSYLPYHKVPYQKAALISNTRGKISGVGPLLCFVDCDHFPKVYVTNVITRKWKLLPPRPNMTYPAIVQLLLVGGDAYKVILITPLETPCSQIYDSVTNSWTIRYSGEDTVSSDLQLTAASSRWVFSNRAWISSNNAWTNSAYFDGMLYVLWGYQYDGPCELLAYNVEEGTWINIVINILRPSFEHNETMFFISMSRILVCGDSVMIVIHLNIPCTGVEEDMRIGGWRTSKENLVVFKLDRESRQIKEVSRSPCSPLIDTDLNEAASDGENIYFYQKLAPNSSVVVYNVREKSWSSLPPVFNIPSFHEAVKKRHQPEFFLQPTTFSFQPGLNPFIEV